MEVKLTGRIAVKKNEPKFASTRRREIPSLTPEVKLVEVETISSVTAAQKMWVAEEDLFIVKDLSETED
jgi:hypothetical protein